MTNNYAPKNLSVQGHFVKIKDLEIYYEELGKGEPLLLLHGYGGCCQNWYPFVQELSEHYRLLMVDLRGHGRSSNPDNEFTHRQAAKDVFLLLEQLNIGRFAAMGMSTGGMTLLHMATNQPQQITSMVLISATTHFPDQARNIMRRASFDTMPQEVKEMYMECAKRGDEQIRQLITQFNALHNNVDDMNFTSGDLSKIKARTLVVHGDQDHFFPIDIAENLSQSIPEASLWLIPGGGHVPIYDLRIPFAAKALQFLNKEDLLPDL